MLAIFFFLGRNLYRNWNQLISYSWEPKVSLLALSLFLMVGGGLLVALGWSFVLRSLGERVSHPRILRIYYLSEMSKYLPLKIWPLVGRVFLAGKEGVPKVITFASVGGMMILLLVSAIVMVVATLPFWPKLEEAGRHLYLLILLPLGLLALHPRVFQPVVSGFLKQTKRLAGEIQRRPRKIPRIFKAPAVWILEKLSRADALLKIDIRYRRILLLVLYWCGLWILKGLSTFYLLRAVYHEPLPPFSWFILSGIMAISWVVGVINPFTPAGLGVTELSLTILFSSLFSIGAGIATAIAIFIRVWGLIAELICVGITFKMK